MSLVLRRCDISYIRLLFASTQRSDLHIIVGCPSLFTELALLICQDEKRCRHHKVENACPVHFYASMMHEQRAYRDERCDEWTFELFDSFGLE